MSFDHTVQQTVGRYLSAKPKMTMRDVNVFYQNKHALHNINLDVGEHEVLAMVGPSGCGKSTFLRCLNRMNDTIADCRVEGEIKLDDEDVSSPSLDVVRLRSRVGMVFQKPNPFPRSVFENIAYGIKLHGLANSHTQREELVEESLRKAGLWSEVKDRLHCSAMELSNGQQQRLCIARAIAVSPEVILMDEPCSSLDPIATARIEELIKELSNRYTMVVVTHSMQQAARVSTRTAYFHQGALVEVNPTSKIFSNPEHALTEAYITGRFG